MSPLPFGCKTHEQITYGQIPSKHNVRSIRTLSLEHLSSDAIFEQFATLLCGGSQIEATGEKPRLTEMEKGLDGPGRKFRNSLRMV